MKREAEDFELRFFEQLAKQNPTFVDGLIPLAEAYTRRGLYAKGLQVDKRLARLKKSDPVVHYNLACSFALMGEKDDALRALRRAVQLGYRDWEHLKHDSDLKSLRDDPRFKNLIAKQK